MEHGALRWTIATLKNITEEVAGLLQNSFHCIHILQWRHMSVKVSHITRNPIVSGKRPDQLGNNTAPLRGKPLITDGLPAQKGDIVESIPCYDIITIEI